MTEVLLVFKFYTAYIGFGRKKSIGAPADMWFRRRL